MNFLKTLILFFWCAQLSAQCFDCNQINTNGDFEIENNVPGAEPATGILQGNIKNWFNTHGSTDYFNPLWNWYYIDGVDSNMGHMCYGSRPSHKHSEGMYTAVDIIADEDLSYCLSLDYGSYCDSESNGKIHMYFANNLTEGPTSGFILPNPTTHGIWFENSHNVDNLILDESTSFTEFGMTTYTTTFKPTEDYKQLWFYTEFLAEDGEYTNCGFLLDNVKVKRTTSALTDIAMNDLGDGMVELSPVFNKNLENVRYEWTVNGATYTDETIIIAKEDAAQDACLKISDARDACAEKCITIPGLQSVTSNITTVCDYDVCLDAAGGGVPTITGLQLQTKEGKLITLDETSEDFSFPYCIGAWNLCADGAYELEELIVDLNHWFLDNDYEGQALKTEDSGYIEGCRGNMLIILKSEISFLSVLTNNEKVDKPIELTFNQPYCEEVELINDNIVIDASTNVYPNPTQSLVNIDLPLNGTEEECNIQLRMLDGNILETFVVDMNQTNSLQIDLSNRLPGVYYINVEGSNTSESHKIIKL
jgi:hypothetical protein